MGQSTSSGGPNEKAKNLSDIKISTQFSSPAFQPPSQIPPPSPFLDMKFNYQEFMSLVDYSDSFLSRYYRTPMNNVRITRTRTIYRNEQGGKFINQYISKKVIGEGAFGKVKLCMDSNTGKFYV